MRYRYLMIKDEFEENGKKRTGYGIAAAEISAVQAEENHTSVLASFADICPDSARMHRLIQMCNNLALEPIHLADVVEDFLADI